MLVTEQSRDHWMVGKTVRTCGDVGVVEEVREHTIDGETYTRVAVRIEDEIGTFVRNVGSSDVEVAK